uniref:RING-type domain-containing protein n=1 Tax=Oryza nivara TaxID=4536 RepID=A0A0E0J6Q0_ORYNI
MEADDDVSTAALTDGGHGQRHRFTFLLPSQNDDEDATMPPPPTSTDDEDDDFSVDDVAQILSFLLVNGVISGETALLLQILTVALHFDLGGGGGGGHSENDDEDAMMAAPLPSIDDEDDDDGSPLLDQVLCYLLLNGIISGERALQILQNANMPLDLDLDDGGANMPLDLDDGGGFRGVPASAAAVAGLEKQVFHQFDHHGGDDDDDDEAKDSAAGCVICMEEFVAGDEVCAIPCAGNHSFHHHCITEWLGCSNVCPLCRHALPVEEQDEGGAT